MSFEKYKEVSISRELLEQFIIEKLYSMRLVPQDAEIESIEGLPKTPHVPIKFKIKKEDKPVDQIGVKQEDAKMA